MWLPIDGIINYATVKVHATEIMYTYHLDCYSSVDCYRVSRFRLQAPVILHMS